MSEDGKGKGSQREIPEVVTSGSNFCSSAGWDRGRPGKALGSLGPGSLEKALRDLETQTFEEGVPADWRWHL